MAACKLTHAQQIERFGMSYTEALAVRDVAEKSVADLSKARAAWQALSYELRGNKGHPFICPQHPEAVRIKMLSALAAGETVDQATATARAFAFTEPN